MSFQPAHPEQKKILREFCEQEFKIQTAYLIEKYGLKNYNPSMSINFRSNAVASYGGELNDGEPFISIMPLEVCSHVGQTVKFLYDEYDFLHDKEGIGNGSANWKQFIAWTIAHEMAHTVVVVTRFRKTVQKHFDLDIARDLRDHGKLWQHIYRDLRVNFCPEERFPVEYIDFSKHVFFTMKKIKDGHQYTFYRGRKQVGWYVRSNGIIYKATKDFVPKKPTKYQKPAEILQRLT